jgi:hypothetical protein
MNKDPIVEEVRTIRRQIEAEFHNDPEELFRHLQKMEEQFKDRLVCGKPKPLRQAGKRS